MTSGRQGTSTARASIDTHAHVVPPSLADEVGRSGRSLGVGVEQTPQGPLFRFDGLPALRPASGTLATVEPRVSWMDRQGIGTQFLASWLDIQGYSLSAQPAATWARLLNEHLVQSAASHPDRFRALATVPVQDGALAARELEYAIRTLGMIGAMVAVDPMGHDLTQPHLDPLWDAFEGLDVPVVLHPAVHGPASRITPGYLTNSVGRIIDSTLTVTKLILGGLFDRHPRLRMVLVHGGGFFPYQLARIDLGYARGPRPLELRRSRPSDYLEFLYFDTVELAAPAVRMLREIAGADRMMLGSDWVFSVGEEPLAGPAEHAGLRQRELSSIRHATAERLFLKAGGKGAPSS